MTIDLLRSARRGFLLVALVAVIAISGCEKPRPDGMPKLIKCSVTLAYDDGTPAEGVTVALMPAEDGASAKWPSAGVTDATGKTNIVTYGQYPGAPQGEYKVVLQKQLIEGEVNTEDGTGKQTEPIYYYSLVATDYTSVDATPLTMTVGNKATSESFKIGAQEKILIDTVQPGGM